MKTIYFDCFAGAGGDMIVAAMLDAGLDREYLLSQLNLLGLGKIQTEISRVKRGGICGLTFVPTATEKQSHRNLANIVELIEKSGLSDLVKSRSIDIFGALGQAEATVHATNVDKIHFHEVGAADSIIDITGACIAIETIGAELIVCSPLPVGSGIIKCEHGCLPAPAPATVELLKRAKAPIKAGNAKVEMLTPTAAAILTTVCDGFGHLPNMSIESVGYGAGKRNNDEMPNLFRVLIGTLAEPAGTQADTICLLETNVDDATGEQISFVTAELIKVDGVMDVYTTATTGKNSRAGIMVSVICRSSIAGMVQKIIFEQGLTLGIRKQFIQRTKLKRKIHTVETDFGKIRVKVGYFENKAVSIKPEYSDCARVADEGRGNLKAIQQAAIAAFEQKKSK
jgi:pyridinium-3,5-bisthiocarboxylic acid mononucleotide nickel chelatase